MAGNSGDVVQVVLTGFDQAETWQNVFFYRVDGAPTAGYLTGILAEFESGILPVMAAAQHAEIGYAQLYAKNIFTGDEAFLSPLDPDTGAMVSGSANPSFIAASLKLVRQNARVRHGRKSIGGSTENEMTGQEWGATYMGLLQAVGDIFATNLFPGGTDLFVPVIVGRVAEPVVGSVPPVKTYRLPETQAEMADNWSAFTSVFVSPFVSTMGSRKVGHGI